MDKVGYIEETIVDTAGFFASFVVKKQLLAMGETRETLPDEKLALFIEAVVDNSIYDKKVQREVKKKLKSKLQAFDQEWLPAVAFVQVKAKDLPVIDEIFIMTKYGIMVNHFSNERSTEIDEDILSGMLSAIQGFVKDSFQKKEATLKELRMGNFNILIEQGKFLSVVIISPAESLKVLEKPAKRMIAELEEKNRVMLEKQGMVWDGALVGADEGIHKLVNPAS